MGAGSPSLNQATKNALTTMVRWGAAPKNAWLADHLQFTLHGTLVGAGSLVTLAVRYLIGGIYSTTDDSLPMARDADLTT